jgi:hypothetical protein
LHIIVDNCGEILSFSNTKSKVDDRKPVSKLAKNLIGKIFGDRGYVSELLATGDVESIIILKKI